MIPYSRQHITEDDIAAVQKVLRSDFLTQGPTTRKFEQSIADRCGSAYAISTCNASAALHTACAIVDVAEGSSVWVSSVSFVASANCVRQCGAKVDFLDIDPDTGLICIESLRNKLIVASAESVLPKALIVVHLAGQSCQMEQIASLCKPLGIYIIEDASHALGSTYQEKPIGSCQYSDVCVFSFHPVKPITAGEGGMLTTNDRLLAEKARLFCSNGVVRETSLLCRQDMPEWYYEQHELGHNYRLSDLHSALGLSQLSRIDEFRKKRDHIARLYSEAIKELDLKPLSTVNVADLSAWHLYVVRFSNQQVRDQAYQRLKSAGFRVNLHYIPIFLHPYYQQYGYDIAAFPGAMQYYQTALSLPLYPEMDPSNVTKVVKTISSLLAS